MKRTVLFSLSLLLASATTSNSYAAEVVAFWGFADDYNFSTPDTLKYDFTADVDNTASGNANLQGYIGLAASLDSNGGGGAISYTSPTSGITYAPTRTLKWDDARGGGPDFDIGGVTLFNVNDIESGTTTTRDFGNDALMYLTFDTTDFMDLSLRFDIEGTPGALPTTFDIFYRAGGATDWTRGNGQNNIPLTFQDYVPLDPDNQFADSGSISLASTLNNQSSVELILSDFADNGNNEMEIDNFEIIGTRISSVPEPSSVAVLAIGIVGYSMRRRKRKV
ncbi:MAG: PEP-CTERM sorting domain-containing protein [Rubripirellula sp.]